MTHSYLDNGANRKQLQKGNRRKTEGMIASRFPDRKQCARTSHFTPYHFEAYTNIAKGISAASMEGGEEGGNRTHQKQINIPVSIINMY